MILAYDGDGDHINARAGAFAQFEEEENKVNGKIASVCASWGFAKRF